MEDDLADYNIRSFFAAFGTIKSIVCVHRSRCAFVNFATRAGAEAAAEACQGKALIAGCPLRVQWGRPRPLDGIDRSAVMSGLPGPSAGGGEEGGGGGAGAGAGGGTAEEQQRADAGQGGARSGPAILQDIVIAKPPGEDDDVRYPSQIAS